MLPHKCRSSDFRARDLSVTPLVSLVRRDTGNLNGSERLGELGTSPRKRLQVKSGSDLFYLAFFYLALLFSLNIILCKNDGVTNVYITGELQRSKEVVHGST